MVWGFPSGKLKLIFQALGSGIGFVAFLNASTEVGTLSVELKPVYDFFVGIAYYLIANNQTERTASFWDDVERQLKSSSTADLNAGLDYLEDYFLCDVSLSPSAQEEKQNQLKQVESKTPKEEKVKAIKSLIMRNVRRKDLLEVLKKFQCSSELLDKYFSDKS